MSITAYEGLPGAGMSLEIPQAGETTRLSPAHQRRDESLAAPAATGQGADTLQDFTAWVRSQHLSQAATVSAGCPDGQVAEYCSSVERLTRLHGALMLLQEFGA